MANTIANDAVPFSRSGFRRAGIRPAPSPATLHRWRVRGLCGVRLETFLRGGRRFVNLSSIADFFERVTAARDGCQPSSPNQPASKCDPSLRQAEAELDADGIA
jgi:hypothetical protein